VDVLFLREADQLGEAFLAPEAGLLDAAERRAEEVLADFVDPHVAGLYAHRGAMRRRQIFRPMSTRALWHAGASAPKNT